MNGECMVSPHLLGVGGAAHIAAASPVRIAPSSVGDVIGKSAALLAAQVPALPCTLLTSGVGTTAVVAPAAVFIAGVGATRLTSGCSRCCSTVGPAVLLHVV